MLFVIDPRPYEAELKQAQAQLDQARSQLTLATSEQDRADKLLGAHAISRGRTGKPRCGFCTGPCERRRCPGGGGHGRAEPQLHAVTAPLTGVVSRAEITAGNLVTSGQTLLTTVVSVDPIYVSFQGDEQGFLNPMNYARQGREAEASIRYSWVWPMRKAIRIRAPSPSWTTRSTAPRTPFGFVAGSEPQP